MWYDIPMDWTCIHTKKAGFDYKFKFVFNVPINIYDDSK